MSYAPFRASGPTVTLSAAAASVAGTWNSHVAANSPVVRVTNGGTDTVFIKTGKAPVTAGKSDIPLLPNQSMFLLKGGDDGIAAIAASSTATVYATPGYGDY